MKIYGVKRDFAIFLVIAISQIIPGEIYVSNNKHNICITLLCIFICISQTVASYN